jgi:hypothetical protein
MFEIGKIQKIIDRLASHATLWPWLLGSGIMSAVAGWAAYATELFRSYAPFSWVAAIICTGLISACFYALLERAKLWSVNRKVAEQFYKSNDRINPLETTFRERRINIADIVSPIETIVRNKTFIDCELIGPANISISNCTLTGVGFINCECVKIKDGVFIQNGYLFKDCQFVRGKIFRVTILVPSSQFKTITSGVPGLPCISNE